MLGIFLLIEVAFPEFQLNYPILRLRVQRGFSNKMDIPAVVTQN